MLSDPNTAIAPAPIIAPKHIFGLASHLKNHVHFLSEQKILYPAGHNLIVYNIEDKTQQYISGHENYRGFTALSISPLRKFIAFAEKGTKPSIMIYDTTRFAKKKQYVFSDHENHEVSAIAFLPGQENKYLVCASGAPENQIHFLQWSSNKIVASARVGSESTITELQFNKQNPKILTCLGPQIFRCYNVNDTQITLKTALIPGLNNDNSRVFTTHTSLNDGKIVVCTQKGEIILLSQECDFLVFLQEPSMAHWHIESVIAFSKGFLVGGDSQTIHLYESTGNDRTYYGKSATVATKEVVDSRETRITALSILDTAENKILCSTQNNTIYSVSLNSAAQLSEEYFFEPLTEQFHCGAINYIDVSIRKPLIVTCSSDRSVRIWNYQNFTLEHCKYYLEEAFAVSIHPSGFHLLVSFSDRIRMINIGAHNHWYEDATSSKEYSRIKGCRVLQFSKGGQFFACVNGSAQNNQQIQIFSTFSGESLGYPPLRGHFGKIKSLVWTKDDRFLVSCGQDGMTYIWRVSDGSRLYEFNSRGPSMSGVVIMDDNKTVLGVGSDKTIKKMSDTMIENVETFNVLNQLALTNSNKLLFGGAAEDNQRTGYIRSYKLPVLNTHVSEHQVHDEQGVTAMKVTNDDQFLVTAGKDGVLAIFEVKDKEARAFKMRDGFANMAEEFLVTKKDIDELRSHYEALKAKVSEKRNEPHPPAVLEKDEIIKQLNEKKKALLENEQLKYANLENTLKETEQKYFDYIEAKKKEHEKEVADVEGHYHEITIKKVTAIEKQKQEQELAREKYRKEISVLINDHNGKIKNIEDDYAYMIEDELKQKNKEVQNRERIKREHEEMVRQIEEEIDKEIENLEEKNNSEIRNIMDKGLKSKGDVSIAKRKYEQLRRDEGELLEKEREYNISKEELEVERAELKEALDKQKIVINAKDDIISDKEKRIYELKKRTQELEKFKAVLDFKIKELKKDIGPREEEIVRMKSKTNEMDMDLKKLSTINNTLGLVVDELDRKQTELQGHIKSQRNTLGKQASRLKDIKDDVYKTVQFILDYDELKSNVLQMKDKYADQVTKSVDIDHDILNEYLAQRKYLEKSVDMLKQNLNKDQAIHKQDNFRIMKDNVQLIKQINLLRQEISNIQLGVKGSENAKEQRSPAKTWGDNMNRNNTELSEEVVNSLKEKKKLVDHQKHQLRNLKEKINQYTEVGIL